ncbi:hypothetical protein [Pseudoteredinibacter isoporae]|uniref:hypothetical protein n=1 Tax=Pseudoteredinibacter isoporae TaxID=570281 RepID=UPI003107E43B
MGFLGGGFFGSGASETNQTSTSSTSGNQASGGSAGASISGVEFHKKSSGNSVTINNTITDYETVGLAFDLAGDAISGMENIALAGVDLYDDYARNVNDLSLGVLDTASDLFAINADLFKETSANQITAVENLIASNEEMARINAEINENALVSVDSAYRGAAQSVEAITSTSFLAVERSQDKALAAVEEINLSSMSLVKEISDNSNVAVQAAIDGVIKGEQSETALVTESFIKWIAMTLMVGAAAVAYRS